MKILCQGLSNIDYSDIVAMCTQFLVSDDSDMCFVFALVES